MLWSTHSAGPDGSVHILRSEALVRKHLDQISSALMKRQVNLLGL